MIWLLRAIRSILRRMPRAIRYITGICLLLAGFLPAALLPSGGYSIDGVPVSWREFWLRAGGPLFAAVGVVSGVGVYGLMRVRRWVRPLLIIAGAGLTVVLIVWEGRTTLLTGLMILLARVLVPRYLYFARSAREYFGDGET
jgi:hypothetical protein